MPQSVEKLSDTRSDLAEGALWDPNTNRFYWCDILGKAIHARDWETGEERSWTFPSTVGSFGLTTRDNVLVVALRDRVVTYDLKSREILDTLAEIEADDERTRTNDGKVGPDGAFYVGTMDDRPTREPIGALYRVTASGETDRLVGELTISNGLAWSPDGRTMYHADSRPGRIDAYDFNPASGDMSNRRTFVQLTNETGRPDGGTVDANGHYWSAGVSAGVVNRFDRDGQLVERIDMPVPRPTMTCFCGPHLDAIAVTSLRPLNDEALLSAYPQSGHVFLFQPGAARGLPPHRFKL
uniref:SMP-30/gluconolactonase/LRE family protein n=1 Tax=Stappia sp. TaxID=1870903 RepID=UPI003BAAB7EE